MRASIENEGDDYGTLIVDLDREDDLSISYYEGRPQIKLPLYAFQARELVDLLRPLAEKEMVT